MLLLLLLLLLRCQHLTRQLCELVAHLRQDRRQIHLLWAAPGLKV